MKRFTPPNLVRQAVCVTSEAGDGKLAAVVSSYFNASGTYFVVFKFPKVDEACQDLVRYEDDGFLLKMRAGDARTEINNALVRFPAERVLLVGLSGNQKSYFSFLPNRLRIEIDSESDVEARLTFLQQQFSGVLPCRKSQIARGLILAKRDNKLLRIDETAPHLPLDISGGGEGLIVLESNSDVSDVIVANYAYSVAADLKVVNPVHREEVSELQRYIYEWKRQQKRTGFSRLARKVHKRLGHPDYSDYKFVTFVTEGLPYGLVLGNTVPFSHVLRSLREDFFIFNNILREIASEEFAFNSAVVFSPEPDDMRRIAQEECEYAMKTLERNSLVVKSLMREEASVRNLDNFGSHYPYDLLHICSHGGETNGKHVVEEFVDRKGMVHKVEYEEVIGWTPYDSEQAQVFRKLMFRRFDGFKWMSPELRQQRIPSYVFEDMRTTILSPGFIGRGHRAKLDRPVYGSCHIRCFESIHQGHFRVLGSQGFPIAFNNTCSSWWEIAITMIAAGCRGYVGTMWDVKNSTALDASKCFYNSIFDLNLIDSVFAMNKGVVDPKDKDIYLFWGLHFQSLNRKDTPSRQRILVQLLNSLRSWSNLLKSPLTPEVRRNSVDIARFVKAQIINEVAQEEMFRLSMEDVGRLEEIERIEPVTDDTSEDLSNRGVFDVPD